MNPSKHLMLRLATLAAVVFTILTTLSRLGAVPAYAQGQTGTVRLPDSVEAVVVVLGLGALVLVGFVYAVRSGGSANSDDEDDE